MSWKLSEHLGTMPDVIPCQNWKVWAFELMGIKQEEGEVLKVTDLGLKMAMCLALWKEERRGPERSRVKRLGCRPRPPFELSSNAISCRGPPMPPPAFSSGEGDEGITCRGLDLTTFSLLALRLYSVEVLASTLGMCLLS